MSKLTNILTSTALKPLKVIKKTLARFEQDRSGVAAVEFALIAPIMIMMYFGIAEVSHAIAIDRKVSHATNVAGDLATQVTELQTDDVKEVLVATLKVLAISDSQNVNIELASYDLDPSNNPRLLGRVNLNSGSQPFKPFDPAALDGRILSQDSGIVVARIAYDFEPLQLRFFDSNVNLRETFMFKPRQSEKIQIGNNIGDQVTCTSSGYDSVSCTGP